MKKKPSRKTQKKKADKLWSEIIRQRNNGCCEICNKPANNPHHVVGRINHILRWDVRDGVNLCFTHHVGGKFSAHNDPIWFMNWFKKNRPEDYEYLRKKKNKLWDKDYDKVLVYLKAIEKLKGVL